MAHQSDLIAKDIRAYLKAQEEKSMLRFITCGSVDDGKSTLIGRLLWDSKMVFEDQLAALEADSRRVGTQGQNIDYALLLDGLQAEREQGITIDVAYRYFSTDKRKFIVADTPGHEQYTRNMVTGASTAQVAVILIDARKGVLTQTRRHSYLVSLVGIRHVVLAINKMDLVGYDAERFQAIRSEYEAFAAGLGFDQIAAIPISALNGDNVIERSERTGWYGGPTLMEYLETVQVADFAASRPFRLQVQWVNRPDLHFRGFSGTVISGTVRPGDEIVVPSSGQKGRIARIVTLDGDLDRAIAGQAVTLTLDREIDISRGDTLSSAEDRPYHTDHLEAKVVWLHEEALVPGRSYLLKTGAATAPARVTALQFKVNVNTLEQEPGDTLALNEVGVCTVRIDKPVTFDSYRENRGTGNFILIDRLTNATVGAGMIHQPLVRKGEDWKSLIVDRTGRSELKGQRAQVLWFTATDGTDTALLASLVEKKLYSLGRHTHLLDAATRHKGLAPDLAASTAAADEELRRLAEVAGVCAEAGLIVLVAPPQVPGVRQTVRNLLDEEVFTEVFIGPWSGDGPESAPEMVFEPDGESLERLAERIAGLSQP